MSTKQFDNFNKDFKVLNPDKIKIACVVSEWHNEITMKLFNGAKDILTKNGIHEKNISRINVPGSFELIFACKNLINKNFDAVIAIGCIIQGETRHFEFVSSAVVNGIKDLNIKSEIPIILCVSTDDNINQSIDRSGDKFNKGMDSAIAALKMITLNQ
ncbi:MAG: 6,7-dimethyl-8-ribityllumazine synthase [Bacteroidetes bacterium]|nr:6,7-dimethyl-8-ribityllumazine synthase [Bacteroidota bacterium]MDA0885555.1 6,7-dimethyl-8-ribityllumazine synthase [Bacteroidota bacterium]MDA1225514.1 6,7-dimethyl-8-ribityllumazine synthase [Bacteroidota bacterium]